jgi:hypothetical protein
MSAIVITPCIPSRSLYAQTLFDELQIEKQKSTAYGDKDALTWNGAITYRSASRRTGTICQFMSGPKAHGWHDFAPFPAAPVESICDDGAGSVGVVQTNGHGDRY